jgi:hypothetical protein
VDPHADRRKLMAKLDAEGRPDLASRLSKCGRPMTLRCCSCTDAREVLTRCDLKWCPACQRATVARTADRYARIAADCQWPLFVTWTCQHSLADGPGLMHAVRRSHTKLRRLRWFKRAVAGGMIGFETTFSESAGWHPHGHSLIDCRWLAVTVSQPRFGASKSEWKNVARRAVDEVSQQWSLALGRKGSVHVRRCWTDHSGGIGGAVHEVIKYSVKGRELADSEFPVAPLIDELDRARLVASWGTFYRHPGVKRRRGAPAMCKCGCSEWLPEDILARTAVNCYGVRE